MQIPMLSKSVLTTTIALTIAAQAIQNAPAIAQLTVKSNGVISGTVQLPNKNPNFNAGTTRVDTDSQGRYFRNGVLIFSADAVNPALVVLGTSGKYNGKYYVDFRGIPVVSIDGTLTSPDLQGNLKSTQRFNNDAPVKLWGNVQDELVLKGNFVGTVTDPATGKQYQGTFEVKGQGPRYSDSNGGTSPTVFDFQSQYRGTDPKISAQVTVKSYGMTAVPVTLSITIPANATSGTSNPGSGPVGGPGSPIASPDTGDLTGFLNSNPRFFEVNRIVLEGKDVIIGPKSRILLR
jgi:hypothetical protein